MERPTITIEGKKYEMKDLVGKDWRIMGEFVEASPTYLDADFIEKNAAFIAEFYDTTAEEILDKMPLEEILPASRDIQSYMINQLSAKIKVIEKNAEAGKEQ